MKYIKEVVIPLFFFTIFFPNLCLGVTYATFDSGNKSSNITLSNGNLTAKAGTVTNGTVSATIHKTTGKWYYEIYIDAHLSFTDFGISNSTFNWTGTNRIGDTVNAWAYLSDGSIYHNNTNPSYGASTTAGDVVGVAVDVDGGTIEFYKNGVSQGVAYNTGLPADIYFGVGLSAGAVDQITANFGASNFAFMVPTGYCEGLSDTCVTGGGGSPPATTTTATTTAFSYNEDLFVSCVIIFFISLIGWGIIFSPRRSIK